MKLVCVCTMALFLSVSLADAWACRGGETATKQSLADAMAGAKFVFIGEVTAEAEPQISPFSATSKGAPKSNSSADVLAALRVKKSWKGAKVGSSIRMNFQSGRSCDLGRFVEVGSKWLVIANRPEETLQTASHSHRLFSSQEEAMMVVEIEKVWKAQSAIGTKPKVAAGKFQRSCAPNDGPALGLNVNLPNRRSLEISLWGEGLASIKDKRDIVFAATDSGQLSEAGNVHLCKSRHRDCHPIAGTLRFVDVKEDQEIRGEFLPKADKELTDAVPFRLEYFQHRVVCG